ncbi:MAG: NAD(P)/FAD-dependent oxidoreductase [Candidatus Nitrosocosmicus sp.]
MEIIKTNQNKNDNQNIIDDNSDKYNDIFDVAIIGGGFAGLSAALLLGRYLRSTIIFDVREPRKSLIHGYLGFERTPRENLIQKSWEDVLQYKSVKKVEEIVQKVEKDTNNNLFLITSEATEREIKEKDKKKSKDDDKNNFNMNRKAKSKYLIIAPGIKHVKPSNIKNFEEFDGNGIWHCPHCDGFEAKNKTLIIIIADNKIKEALDYAKLFLGWTKDITIFTHKVDDKDNNRNQKNEYGFNNTQKDEAKTLGIERIENDNINEIVTDPKSNSIKGIITKSGKFHKADVIFYHFEQIIPNKVAIQLGCELEEGYVKVNEKQQTTILNVYAAGDIDTDRHYAILAAASGALAAISIYEQLLKDAIKSIKIHK